MLTTIWRVHEGESLIQPAVASSILFELAEGTIKNNVSNILSKLHAANRVQAVNAAREQKLI